MTSKESPSLVGSFNRNRQTWQLFRDQTPRLLLTWIFLALCVVTLVLFEKRHNVTHNSKTWYNTIATIINLALGLNFLEAFKDMAKVLRWRILANRSFSVREADLIMSGESLLTLGKLMLESPKKPLTLLVCAIWIALNFLAQGSIALLSLNASMDGGTDSTGIYSVNGTVNAATVDCFYSNGHCPVLPSPQMTTANTLGQAVQGQQRCTYQIDADIFNAPQSCAYFGGIGDKSGEFAYRFSEYNPQDVAQAYPYLTNRNIRASPAECYKYDINWAQTPFISDQDGTNDAQLINFGNSTYTADLPMPLSVRAYASTTCVYNGTSPPQSATAITCGPRCMKMYALRLGGNRTDPANTMFECQVTLSTVNNATADYHSIPDSVARIAVSSISLTGRVTSVSGGLSWRQYQLYTLGNYWETGGHTAQQVGENMAEFAIVALGSMANVNPKQLVPGTLPVLGYHLDLQWNYIIALVVCIGVVHLLLVVLSAIIARPVFIPSDSNFVTARLLYGLVKRIDGRGSLLDEKELVEAIEVSSPTGGQVVYGVRNEGDDRVVLLEEDVPIRKKLPGGVFPQGKYA